MNTQPKPTFRLIGRTVTVYCPADWDDERMETEAEAAETLVETALDALRLTLKERGLLELSWK